MRAASNAQHPGFVFKQFFLGPDQNVNDNVQTSSAKRHSYIGTVIFAHILAINF